MSDYLRLARFKHPTERLDVGLLGPVRTSDAPACDDRQRYAEMTWPEIPELLTRSFPGNVMGSGLAHFLTDGLALSSRPQVPPPSRAQSKLAAPFAGRAAVSHDPMVAAAVEHALQLAPSVAEARPGDSTERGIDVVFASERDARGARLAVKQALAENRFQGRITVWVWRTESTGKPLTPAGAEQGRELRLAPVRSTTR